MTTFFTSDTHFGHKNIIEYCKRPFADVKEMDRVLAENWNARVGPDDQVFHLGDFTLGGRTHAKRYFKKLNGVIYVLSYPWHHDKGWHRDPMPMYMSATGASVQLLPPVYVLEPSDATAGHHIMLSHFPHATWDKKHYGAAHFHGHSHGDYPPTGKMWDVGVDPNDYAPVTAAEALAKIPEHLKTVDNQRRHL